MRIPAYADVGVAARIADPDADIQSYSADTRTLVLIAPVQIMIVKFGYLFYFL